MLGSACREGAELSASDKLVTNYSFCHRLGDLPLQPHLAWRGWGVETLILAVEGVKDVPSNAEFIFISAFSSDREVLFSRALTQYYACANFCPEQHISTLKHNPPPVFTCQPRS